MALSYADAAAEVMEHMCSHSAHGYSQPNRAGVGTGGGRGETITLSDGSKVQISVGDRDCSSAAIECYAALGVDCGGASYTGNMQSCMTGTGNFRWISGYSSSAVRRGDILLNTSHHAAVALGGGRLGQFSISEHGTITGTRGDQTGRESNIRSLYNYPWNGILRYCGPSRSGSEGEGMTITIDGKWGSDTTTLAQIVTGAPYVDGVVSRQNPAHKSKFPGCTTGWEWTGSEGKGSPLIGLLQKAWGMPPEKCDNVFGPETANYMIAYYMKKGSGATVLDERLDYPSKTIRMFQSELNAGRV